MANNTSAGAWERYQSLLGAKPGEFKFSGKKPEWSYDETDLNAYYDKLLNRKDFSFDLNNNALYNQYKDFYTKQGQLAAMDTIGRASAMTGGYGNSYAASAAQQAYQQNLDKLGEMVPEIYGLALQQYQTEGEELYNKYDVAKGERDSAYSMFQDTLDRYYYDYDMAYQQHSDNVDRWYNDVDRAYGIYGDARDYEYQQERASVQDSQWAKEFAESQRQSDQAHQLKLKQLAAEQAALEKEYEMWEREFNAKYGDNPMEDSVTEAASFSQVKGIGSALKSYSKANSDKGSVTQTQTERLAGLGMSEEEEKVVMDIIDEIQDMGMVGDTERLTAYINEYGKDLTLSQLKALRIIFLGE